MPSLSSYDKGKRAFTGRSYAKDIESGLEFQERLWGPVRARKKRMPYRVQLEGNHEHRIEKALDMSPELIGTIDFKDYNFDDNNDEVIRYKGNTPGQKELDGITYSHYFVSGVMGRPIGGEHTAHSILSKYFVSCTASHIHTLSYDIRTSGTGRKLHGLVAGCYQDYVPPWAGDISRLWWSGVAYKRNVENGQYDLELISLDQLRKTYGQ